MDGVDRISDLPIELKSVILSRMPFPECVRTCILSKSWTDIWKFISALSVDDRENSDLTMVLNMVLPILRPHLITKFKLLLVNDFYSSTDVGNWVGIAFSFSVEQLSIEIRGFDFSCPDWVFGLPAFSSLKFLEITGISFCLSSEDIGNQLDILLPNLEVFNICCCLFIGFTDVFFHAPRLKNICIGTGFINGSRNDFCCHIVVVAPLLSEFYWFENIDVVQVSGSPLVLVASFLLSLKGYASISSLGVRSLRALL